MANDHHTPLREAQASIADASWHLSNHPEPYLRADTETLVAISDLQSLLCLVETVMAATIETGSSGS